MIAAKHCRAVNVSGVVYLKISIGVFAVSSSKLKMTSVVVAVAVTSDSAITNSGARFLNRISALIALPSLPCLS